MCLWAVEIIIDRWLNDYVELKSIYALRTEFQRVNCNDVVVFGTGGTISVLRT